MSELKPKTECPFMVGDEWHERCGEEVTEQYFKQLCKSPAHINCKRYAHILTLLKTPFDWWMKLAIAEASKTGRENSVVLTEGVNTKDGDM